MLSYCNFFIYTPLGNKLMSSSISQLRKTIREYSNQVFIGGLNIYLWDMIFRIDLWVYTHTHVYW